MSYDQNPYGDQRRGDGRRRARDSRAGGYDSYQRAGDEGYRGQRPAGDYRSQRPSSDAYGRTGSYGAGAGARGGAGDPRPSRGYAGGSRSSREDAYARDRRAGGHSLGVTSSRTGDSSRRRVASRDGRSTAPRQPGRYQDAPQLGGGDRRRASGSYARQSAGNRYSTPTGGRSNSRGRGQAGRRSANGRGGAPKIGMPRLTTSAFSAHSAHSRGGMPAGGGRRVDFAGARPAIIGIACVAIFAIVGILLWSNRKVDIKLNGEDFSVRVNSRRALAQGGQPRLGLWQEPGGWRWLCLHGDPWGQRALFRRCRGVSRGRWRRA